MSTATAPSDATLKYPYGFNGTQEQLMLLVALREIAADWSNRNMTGLARSDERQRIARAALAKAEERG